VTRQCLFDPCELCTRSELLLNLHLGPSKSLVITMSRKELGFEQLEQHFIDEYKSTATLYWHQKIGVEIMSVTNEDEIRSLALSFTPHRK